LRIDRFLPRLSSLEAAYAAAWGSIAAAATPGGGGAGGGGGAFVQLRQPGVLHGALRSARNMGESARTAAEQVAQMGGSGVR